MKMHSAVRLSFSLSLSFGLMGSGLVPAARGAGSPVMADLEANAAAQAGQQLTGPAEQRAVALAHYLAARNLEAAGKGRDALPHYLSFLKGNAGEPELVAHIAELTLNIQGVDAAVELLEQGLKAHPKSPGPAASLIQFCLTHGTAENGLLTRAAKVAEDALTTFPREAAAYESAVRLHLTQRRRSEAGALLERALSTATAPPAPPSAFWMALARMAQEVWPLADQENRAAHLVKVNAFVTKAREQAQASSDSDALIQVADYYLFSNQIDQAVAICEDLVNRTNSLDARKRLVRLYEAMERQDDSFKALKDLVEAYPSDVEHRRMLGAQLVQKQEIGPAADQFEAALQAGGGDLNDYLNVCKLLRFSQNPERFEKFTQRAQQLYPGEPRITYHRAIALTQGEKNADAAKLFEQAARQAETNAAELLDDQFHFHWGVALERSRQFDAAARQFEKSITLTPAHDPPRAANTMNYLGYMWLDQGQNLDKAEQLIRKANELEQNNPAFVDSLGWLLIKRGKAKEGLSELLRAEHLMKEFSESGADAEILDHIAQAYEQLGQMEEAKTYWKRVLDVGTTVEGVKDRAQKALGVTPPPPVKKTPTDKE